MIGRNPTSAHCHVNIAKETKLQALIPLLLLNRVFSVSRMNENSYPENSFSPIVLYDGKYYDSF